MIACAHPEYRTNGKDRHGNTRYRCKVCGKTWVEVKPVKPLGKMTGSVADAKLALRLLVEGASLRSVARITSLDRATVCKLLVTFGERCRTFLDERMRGLKLTHLQFDEQWTYVAKKQSRLTTTERVECCDMGDVYLWTCIDQKTKLLPSFRIGKRSADNARRFMMDVAERAAALPSLHTPATRTLFQPGGYLAVVQISTDGFAAYPEAVDLAFGPYVRHGTIIYYYTNSSLIYTPSEMVGTKAAPWDTRDRPGPRAVNHHVARRAVERHPAAFPQAAESAYAVLLKEAGEPRSGVCDVRRVV